MRERRYRGYRCVSHDTLWTAYHYLYGFERTGTGVVLAWLGWAKLKHAIDASYRTPGIEDSDDEGDDDG